MAAQRGLVSVFTSLSHKCPSSRLGKHDETGMTLMHHSAVHNRHHIITVLVQLGQDVNVRKISSVFAAGLSCLELSLNISLYCLSLEALSCKFYIVPTCCTECSLASEAAQLHAAAVLVGVEHYYHYYY